MDKAAEKRRQKKAERNRRKRKAKHKPGGSHGQSPAAAATISLPSAPARAGVRSTYANPETLVQFGPIIKGAFSVPRSLAALLQQNGRPVPPQVAGYLLIDTGAGSLCIAERVTQELGLKAVGLKKTSGVHGTQQNEVFHVRLEMEFSASGAKVTVQSEQQVLSVPGLDSHWDATQLTTTDPHPRRLIGLLGRDFLRHATLIYNGATGIVDVQLDLATMPPIPTKAAVAASGAAPLPA